MLIFEGKEIETDTEGYLKESSQWSEPLAVVITENEGIALSPEHWEVWCVLCVISITEFNTSPAIRMLVKRWRINLAKKRQQPLSVPTVPERSGKTSHQNCWPA